MGYEPKVLLKVDFLKNCGQIWQTDYLNDFLKSWDSQRHQVGYLLQEDFLISRGEILRVKDQREMVRKSGKLRMKVFLRYGQARQCLVLYVRHVEC